MIPERTGNSMGILLLIALIVLITLNVLAEAKAQSAKLEPEVVEVKQCPPHKWRYVEVKDTEGNTVKWKIVCDVCGPMQSQERPSGGDYS